MRKRIFKGFAAVLLSSTLTVSTVFAVFADDVDKLKQQKQQTQQELDNLQDQWAYLLQQMDDLDELSVHCQKILSGREDSVSAI